MLSYERHRECSTLEQKKSPTKNKKQKHIPFFLVYQIYYPPNPTPSPPPPFFGLCLQFPACEASLLKIGSYNRTKGHDLTSVWFGPFICAVYISHPEAFKQVLKGTTHDIDPHTHTSSHLHTNTHIGLVLHTQWRMCAVPVLA